MERYVGSVSIQWTSGSYWLLVTCHFHSNPASLPPAQYTKNQIGKLYWSYQLFKSNKNWELMKITLFRRCQSRLDYGRVQKCCVGRLWCFPVSELHWLEYSEVTMGSYPNMNLQCWADLVVVVVVVVVRFPLWILSGPVSWDNIPVTVTWRFYTEQNSTGSRVERTIMG